MSEESVEPGVVTMLVFQVRDGGNPSLAGYLNLINAVC